MSQLIADCPRCRARNIAFDLKAYTKVGTRYQWQSIYEAFCICSHCADSTVFVLGESGINEAKALQKVGLNEVPVSANSLVKIEGYISLKDAGGQPAPEHVPPEIVAIFNEGATCNAVGCHNAAACMFRLCVDMATEEILPKTNENGLNNAIRRSLGLRLPWLFDNHLLPEALRELSSCIKEDGNDGAHAGTLGEEDAQDLLDFTSVLLERMYTEPKQLALAKERRDARRGPKA